MRKTPVPHPCLQEVSIYGGFLVKTLPPWFITGLVEGEGCFSVSFSQRKRLKLGIETRPSFSLSLNRRDLRLLEQVQAYFGCGGIRYSRSDRTYKYEVRSVPELARKVLPHFERHPLQGSKAEDFRLFAEIVRMVYANLHRNPAHLRQIIKLAYQMNPAGKRRYTQEELLRMLGEVMV